LDSNSSSSLTIRGAEPGHRRSALGAAFALATAYIERVIGSIRRECIDHVIVFNEASLYRHLKSLSRDQDAPILGEGHAGESFGAVAGSWAGGCTAASRRTASSVRTSGSVKTARAGSAASSNDVSAISPVAGGLPLHPYSRYSGQNQRVDQCRPHCDRGKFG
jgi:hypothetical protein